MSHSNIKNCHKILKVARCPDPSVQCPSPGVQIVGARQSAVHQFRKLIQKQISTNLQLQFLVFISILWRGIYLEWF